MVVIENTYGANEHQALEMAFKYWDEGIRFSTDVTAHDEFVISKDAEQWEPHKSFVTKEITDIMKTLDNDFGIQGIGEMVSTMWKNVDRHYKFFSTMLDLLTEVITMKTMEDIIYTERVIYMVNDIIDEMNDKDAEEFNAFFTYLTVCVIRYSDYPIEKQIITLEYLGIDPDGFLKR